VQVKYLDLVFVVALTRNFFLFSIFFNFENKWQFQITLKSQYFFQ
jgi:hypothetical protein